MWARHHSILKDIHESFEAIDCNSRTHTRTKKSLKCALRALYLLILRHSNSTFLFYTYFYKQFEKFAVYMEILIWFPYISDILVD